MVTMSQDNEKNTSNEKKKKRDVAYDVDVCHLPSNRVLVFMLQFLCESFS